ncbi:hypothetical protein EW145_g5158 [Phellinidium pouzarii]|uniref:N-acetyltransferase domain-containing protein n=1 Tax=Phellinidium pouzarii TaxID=167371 RepID=A0A4S4L0Z7_9AGAM|nr:hypothetical protein EW145_g5158 [Phellinidium pouzarii]
MVLAAFKMFTLFNGSSNLKKRHEVRPANGSTAHISSPTLKVAYLSLRDIFTARGTHYDAFQGDPLGDYVSGGDSSFLRTIVQNLYYWVHLSLMVLSKRVLTIDHGDAISVFAPASAPTRNNYRPTLSEKLLGFVDKVLLLIRNKLCSPEQRKRNAESLEKLQQAIHDSVGEKIKEMIYLKRLATAPRCQKKGYGSALVKAITDIADAEGRACYLVSSNINNSFFYNFHGFYTVAQTILGADNPSWDKKPVVILLQMVREAKK